MKKFVFVTSIILAIVAGVVLKHTVGSATLTIGIVDFIMCLFLAGFFGALLILLLSLRD